MINPGVRFELELPFRADEHGFVPQREGDTGGNVYIQKNAIRRRLDRVSPNWSISEPRLMTIQDDVVTMTAILTIEGQSHGGIGTGIIQRFKKDGSPKPPFELGREVQKALKTAASDTFPRAAYYFGIGWYLRGVPNSWKDKIKTPDGLKAYLVMVGDVMNKAKGDPDRAKELLGNGGGADERRIR